MENRSIYTASRIFTGEDWLHDHAIIVENDCVKELIPLAALNDSDPVTHFDQAVIAPAFIDLQIYGAYGKLLAVFPEPDSLFKLNEYCNKGGTAWFLPTLASNTSDVFRKAIDAVREYWKMNGKGVIGLHLEGPWINKLKRGAHVESLIHSPDLNEVKHLLEYGEGVIKMITVAPEVCSDEVLEYIALKGIIISAGHSNASFEESKNAFSKKVTAVTHLFNAMAPFHHREPGLIGAVMTDHHTYSSIIADGHHVDYAAIHIAYKVMKERLFLITDAVTETDEGNYKHQLAGDKYEANGVLSGSNLTMLKAVQNMVNFAGVELEDALKMASTCPAKVLKDPQLGTLKPGNPARMIVLDENLDLKALL